MKRILPWLLLPCLTFVQADNTEPKSQKSLLNQVSEEAAKTSFENIKTSPSEAQTTNNKPAVVQTDEVDLDQIAQLVAVRLSELLGTKSKADATTRDLSLETVVSDALHDGKQMDAIRSAVAQAMKEVTGQSLQLDPNTSEAEQKIGSQSKPGSNIGLSPKNDITQIASDNTQVNNPGNKTILGESLTDNTAARTTTTVLPGESLFRVAQRVYGVENGRRFLDIFAANRDIIRDINVVHEGLVLKLPQDPVPVPAQ